MRPEAFRPRGHAAAFEPIAAADDRLQVRHRALWIFPPRIFFLGREGGECVGDQGAGVGAEAVVVEDEVLEGHVLAEEIDEGRLGVEAEGVVAEVDGVQVLQGEERGEEGGEGGGDLGEEARGENVGEVGGLEGGFRGEDGGEGGAGWGAEGVAAEFDGCYGGGLLEGVEVR